uniref:Uncharacterized protein n=1 Tax=Parascaris equorum TaxID=6256 RepID=A0A914RVN3_PAREQ
MELSSKAVHERSLSRKNRNKKYLTPLSQKSSEDIWRILLQINIRF